MMSWREDLCDHKYFEHHKTSIDNTKVISYLINADLVNMTLLQTFDTCCCSIILTRPTNTVFLIRDHRDHID